MATYGHTVGHQCFVVDLAGGGGFVLAFDAADLQQNIDDELAPGSLATGDPDEAVESIRRLKAIARERGYRAIPGHDPQVWPAFTAEMGAAGWFRRERADLFAPAPGRWWATPPRWRSPATT